ncbi:hypothetical protein PIROE2DRAFT_5231 [Piromyces sp. E2]|nr:hypothetical protein PIROE2DRAFT_5231 [Piromyces sp. E2]|eukprot:OUM67368.1 hypothetical protein PIROE2DRAFT_5231 [Piromyces sp. E2]
MNKLYNFIFIHNDDIDVMRTIGDKINSSQNDSDLIIRFVDDYYDFSKYGLQSVSIFVNTNISLIGNENGTVFDFNYDKQIGITFQFDTKEKTKTLKIENIKFEKFYPKNSGGIGRTQVLLYFNFYLNKSDNFYIIFNNCNFQNNNHELIKVDIYLDVATYDDYRIQFNNCKFLNNTERLIQLYHKFDEYHMEIYDSIKVLMNNCTFINNRGYFSEIQSDENEVTRGAFITTLYGNEYVIIENSQFENINIQSNVPLIYGNLLFMK